MSSKSLTNCEPDRKSRTKPEQAYRIHGPFHICSKSYALHKMPVGSVMATQKSNNLDIKRNYSLANCLVNKNYNKILTHEWLSPAWFEHYFRTVDKSHL